MYDHSENLGRASSGQAQYELDGVGEPSGGHVQPLTKNDDVGGMTK